MFGEKILVAPVMKMGVRRRTVYLPAKSKWREANTGIVYEGGSWVQAEAPLETVLYFYRE